MEFKVGDKVICIEAYKLMGLKLSEEYEVESTSTTPHGTKFVRLKGFKEEFFAHRFKKVEKDMTKFKIGDVVRITGNTNHSCNEVGDIGVVTDVKESCYGFSPLYKVIVKGRYNPPKSNECWTEENEMELADIIQYEDQWHLNDGKVEIPEDADKLEKDGSVVAFRKRKPPEFKFGDMVKHKNGNIYVVVGKDQSGLYRVISENMAGSVTTFADNLTKI